MTDPAPAQAAREKRMATPARKARRSRPFWMTLVVRGIMFVAMAVVLRMMLYTPQGEALIQQAAERMAELIGPPQAQAVAEAEPVSVVPLDGAQALRDRTSEDSRPRVSAMPGSQGAVRRLEP